MRSCTFCHMVQGNSPAHVIWEDETHLAFLSIFPNTVGATVVIPKMHFSSYAFEQDDAVLSSLIIASKKVAGILDERLEGVGRTAMVFEGYGVDHLHAKLFPMHGTGQDSDFKKISSSVEKYFETYEGYISSHDGKRADDHYLALVANYLTGRGDLVS